MPILVSQLTEGRKLECITVDKSVKEAMQCMLAHDYSQLPVVSVDGKLVGLISDQSIAQRHYYLNGVSLLDYAVTDCCSPAPTIDPNEDIFAILTQLETSYATVVVANESPVGIVTNYDTTQFFVKVAGGLVRVEEIETTLRNDFMGQAFPTDASKVAAVARVFGMDSKNPTKLARDYDGLSLAEEVRLITFGEHWPRFAGTLEPKEMFRTYMERLGSIRNDLAHFRRKTSQEDLSFLTVVQEWFRQRRRPPKWGAASD